MIDWFKRAIGREPSVDESELAWSERREMPTDESAPRSPREDSSRDELRGTVDALRSIGSVQAPRSFALTEENLAGVGFSEHEIQRVLHPGQRRVPLWHRPVLRQVPLAAAVLALAVGAYFAIGDVAVRNSRLGSNVEVVERAQLLPTVAAYAEPTVAAAVAMMDAATSEPRVAAQVETLDAEVAVTVVVERDVERQVEVQREVEIERAVAPDVVVTESQVTSVAEAITGAVTVQAEVAVSTVQSVSEVEVTREAQTQIEVAVDPTAFPTPDVQLDLAEPGAQPTTGPSATVLRTVAESVMSPTVEVADIRDGTGTDTEQAARLNSSNPSDSARIWPSVVALILAVVGLVTWFELRRRRKMWE